MKLTRINWNTDKPKFEDVKGKRIYFEFEANNPPELFSSQRTIRTTGDYNYAFSSVEDNGYPTIRYAVLTDDTFCEWRLENEAALEYSAGCQPKGYKFDELLTSGNCCPFCGLPIKVIEDEQPMELDGVKPETINQRLDVWEARYIKPGITIYIYGESKKQVTERWNSWVKRVSKNE